MVSTVSLSSISKDQFEAIEPVKQIIRIEYPQCFASFQLDNQTFGIGWASDDIDPDVRSIADLLWVGIDNQIAVLNSKGQIIHTQSFLTQFFDFQESKSSVFVISELDVYRFGKDGTLLNQYSLPDVAMKWSLKDQENSEVLEVECFDNRTLTLKD